MWSLVGGAAITWLPVLLLPDTEKDCGLGLTESAQAVYSIPQKFRSILTHVASCSVQLMAHRTHML
jgi:hypothetical protein